MIFQMTNLRNATWINQLLTTMLFNTFMKYLVWCTKSYQISPVWTTIVLYYLTFMIWRPPKDECLEAWRNHDRLITIVSSMKVGVGVYILFFHSMLDIHLWLVVYNFITYIFIFQPIIVLHCSLNMIYMYYEMHV